METGINWDITRDEIILINKITKRAMLLAEGFGIKANYLEMHMDITAVHANGCPLKLEELLNFGDGDFCHDVFGIRRHIDRATGQLKECFDPRCSAPAAAAA